MVVKPRESRNRAMNQRARFARSSTAWNFLFKAWSQRPPGSKKGRAKARPVAFSRSSVVVQSAPPFHSKRSNASDLALHSQVFCRLLPAVGHELIVDALAFVEPAQPSPLDCGNMHEHVLAAILRLDESVTLGRVEPLHSTGRHIDLRRESPARAAHKLRRLRSGRKPIAEASCTFVGGGNAPGECIGRRDRRHHAGTNIDTRR